LFASAILVAVGAQRRRREVVVAGYALVVITIPLASGRLLAAVGDDRSAAALARATAAALDRVSGTEPGGPGGRGGGGAVLGILAYPPSLAFYLGRPLAAALPLIAADGHYAAYGPCVPHVRPPSPQRGEGLRG